MVSPSCIRPAGATDIATLTAIIREAFADVADRFGLTPENCPRHPSNCTEDWVEKDLARGARYFIAETDETAAGCVAVERAQEDLCYLERLSVLPAYRRRGWGGLLTDRALAEIAALGVRQVGIGIIADDEKLAGWYRRRGFDDNGGKTFPHLPFRVAFMLRVLDRPQ